MDQLTAHRMPPYDMDHVQLQEFRPSNFMQFSFPAPAFSSPSAPLPSPPAPVPMDFQWTAPALNTKRRLTKKMARSKAADIAKMQAAEDLNDMNNDAKKVYTIHLSGSCVLESNVTVVGDRNEISGSECVVYGCHNKISGSRCLVYGHQNEVTGNNNTIRGNRNRIGGTGNLVEGRDNICYDAFNNVLHDRDVEQDLVLVPENGGREATKRMSDIGEEAVQEIRNAERPSQRRMTFLESPKSVFTVPAFPFKQVLPNTTDLVPFAFDEFATTQENTCSMCLSMKRKMAPSECGHVFACFACAVKYVSPQGHEGELSCPVCKIPIKRQMQLINV
jgi:hypothetical protein